MEEIDTENLGYIELKSFSNHGHTWWMSESTGVAISNQRRCRWESWST